MSLRRCLPALLALFGCTDGDAMCDLEEVTYHVAARLDLPAAARSGERKASPPGDGSTAAASSDDGPLPGPLGDARLLVFVHEDESIVDCGGDIVSAQVPGRTLLTLSRPLSETLSFAVPTTHYAGLGPSLLLLEVHVDENGNGRCDVGELTGFAALPPGEHVAVDIALGESGCPARL